MRSVGPATCVVVFWASLELAASSKASVTPIQKVTDMLGSMLSKAKEDKQAEAVEWSAFKMFCTNTELDKQKQIQSADIQKASLKADIEQHDSEVKRLGEEITDHGTDIEGFKKDQKAATKDRKAERVAYMVTHEDYAESITAISNAVSVLKKRAADIPQAAALLQQVNSYAHVPAASKRAIESFLEVQRQETKDVQLLGAGAPEANAYEFQSDSIVTMLVELKDKFISERTNLEKKELVSRQAYDTVSLDLKNSIDNAENEVDKKSHTKAEEVAGSTEANTLLKETKAARDEDQDYLTNLIGQCQNKAADFATRQALREEGITAIGKAMEIIGGQAVSGTADKHDQQIRQGLVQMRKGSSLVQFLSATDNPSQKKAIAFLNEESLRLDSHVLSALAMQAAGDPFEKVKKMIGDLISKLKAQAAEEADHKQWCDAELKANKKTRGEKTSEVDELSATIEQLESRLAVLKKDLAGLSADIAEINTAVAQETEARNKEKEINDKTMIEAVAGQTAIAQAKKILSDFFAKAGANTAFVQVESKEPPTFDSAFKGQQTQGNNVIAFLDVINSDFARLETDTKKAEDSAQADYDQSMDESKKLKEAKEKEEDTKRKEQLDKKDDLQTANDNLESAQNELTAALDYFDKLKPSCVNTAPAFEDRVKGREEEIASLKEALEMLNGEGAPSGPESLYSSTQGGNLAVDYR